LNKLLCIVFTFHLVCFAWIFFRAESLNSALTYISRLGAAGRNMDPYFSIIFGFYLLVVILIDWSSERKKSETPALPQNPCLRGFLYGCALFLLVFVGSNDSLPFVYFQF